MTGSSPVQAPLLDLSTLPVDLYSLLPKYKGRFLKNVTLIHVYRVKKLKNHCNRLQPILPNLPPSVDGVCPKMAWHPWMARAQYMIYAPPGHHQQPNVTILRPLATAQPCPRAWLRREESFPGPPWKKGKKGRTWLNRAPTSKRTQ